MDALVEPAPGQRPDREHGRPAAVRDLANGWHRSCRRGRWTRLEDPAPVHHHEGHTHGQPKAVTTVDGRLYAAGTSEGVSASADGGRTWTQPGGGLGSVTAGQVIEFRGGLFAATSDGLYCRFALRQDPPASPLWWVLVLMAAAGLGLSATGISGLGPAKQRSRPG